MPTADAFLNAHLIDGLVSHIGGRLWPISIRDQALRGRLIIDRAIEQGMVDDNRPVAVVGAGMAGVTAAMCAAEQGVRTVLLERDRLFARHAACRTRWVHPTQYDWLVGHWDAGSFPWPGTPRMPLTWRQPDYANALALDWENQFHMHYPRLRAFLTVHLYATALGHTSPAAGTIGPVVLDWRDVHGTMHHDPFGIVIIAMGFGEERTTISKACPYRGFEFWATDPFSLPNLGCTKPPRVLISGGGDGSLQDFLRIATICNSAEDIWRRLPARSQSMVASLRDAEDQALRAFSWGPGVDAHFDCAALTALHQQHFQCAAALYADPRVPACLDTLIRHDFEDLKLVHSCAHFSQCYSLNRFLTLLVVRHLEAVRPGLTPILHQGFTLTDVRGVGHRCTGPATCHGQLHQTSISPQPTCARTRPIPTSWQSFEVVVVRHGIEPTPVRTSSGVTMPPLRQLLPYHLPN
jgi:hypothetical protein